MRHALLLFSSAQASDAATRTMPLPIAVGILVVGIAITIVGYIFVRDSYEHRDGQLLQPEQAWWLGPKRMQFGCLPILVVGALLTLSMLGYFFDLATDALFP